MPKPSLYKTGDKEFDAFIGGVFDNTLQWMAIVFKETGQITPKDVAAQIQKSDVFYGFFPYAGEVRWRVIKGAPDLTMIDKADVSLPMLCSGVFLDTLQEAEDWRLVLGDGKPDQGGQHGPH